jgi:crotonobetainyl-CoA:carnitine CoA-transferase CaiB-like acyl-CoA transferase
LSFKQRQRGMLAPYRILDLTNEHGFFCGKVLGDLGADVLKIEKPGGDPSRNIGPFYHDIPDPEKSLYWWAFNTSKKGITLDIHTSDGKELFKKLVKKADVLLESFNPGYMDELNLGYAELNRINPRLVMTSISGFGQNGPYKDYKASDIVIWALSGNAFLTGDPDRGPLSPSFPISYVSSGALQAAIGTLTAIYQREITGEGQQVDVSAQLSLVWNLCAEPYALWEHDKTIVKRQGRYWERPQINVGKETTWLKTPLFYQCQDGDVSFALATGASMGWSTNALAKWIDSEGLASDILKGIDWTKADLQTLSDEVMEQVTADFNKFFMAHTKTELLKESQKRGIQLYPAFTPRDMLEFEQLKERNYWIELEHPELKTSITYPGPFVKATESPQEISRRAPLIGEHNEEIYINELGLSRQELLTLKQAGII